MKDAKNSRFEYRQGAEARQGFERTMTALFRVSKRKPATPRATVKKAARPSS
jgi:hypothetical protein